MQPRPAECESASRAAKARLLSLSHEPLFLADWSRVLMIHFEVDPTALQAVVPFPLDLWHGRAFVSLVPFTLEAPWPVFGRAVRAGGQGTRRFRLGLRQQFLNVRTYVKLDDEAGIFFLREWISGWWSIPVARWLFGLPYRPGYLTRIATRENGRETIGGQIKDFATRQAVSYRADWSSTPARECEPGSLTEWLMERYTAFTETHGVSRFFRVWHPPWRQIPVEVEVFERGLLTQNWPFFARAPIAGANYSPGLKGVWMGRPHCLTGTLS